MFKCSEAYVHRNAYTRYLGKQFPCLFSRYERQKIEAYPRPKHERHIRGEPIQMIVRGRRRGENTILVIHANVDGVHR